MQTTGCRKAFAVCGYVFIGPRPLGPRRAPASPSHTHSCKSNRIPQDGDCGARVWLCPPSRVVVRPYPCRRSPAPSGPVSAPCQVADPTQSQCHPTQPCTRPIQPSTPYPVRTSYPALQIRSSSPRPIQPSTLTSFQPSTRPIQPSTHPIQPSTHPITPLVWRGSGAGPSARARRCSCCSSAACCPEAAHRPRRLRQRRAPASRARQTPRRPGAACPTAWPKCENEGPLRRSDASPKS